MAMMWYAGVLPSMANLVSDDLELLRAWRNGDTDCGEDLLKRHLAMVARFFRSKVGDATQELIQRTFLGCVESRDVFDETRGTTFRAYLLGIARMQLLLYFREQRREHRRYDFGQVSIEAIHRELGTERPSQAVAAREEQRVVFEAMQRIPVDFHITIELFFWEELSIREIAAVLGVAAGTVKSRLHRAKRMLREQISALVPTQELGDSALRNLDEWTRSLVENFEPEDKDTRSS